jgi:uncharacterized protein (DUF1501 family)
MLNRRHFLQQSAAWGSLLAVGHSAAQTATDYKALVCIFLAGGNDSFNTVLATDSASWAAYTATRNQAPTPINLLPAGTAPNASAAVGSPEWLGGVLPLSPSVPVAGRSFALHPKLGQLQRLFNTERRLAVVANVGPLLQPLTKADYQTNRLPVPAKLFSHNDQQNMWQALGTEGVTQGWGGRLLDSFVPASQQPNLYASISVAGNAVFNSGARVRQFQMAPTGAIALGGNANWVYGQTGVAAALRKIASNGLNTGTARQSHVLMADLGGVAQRAMVSESTISAALAATPTSDTRVGPDTRLQMQDLDGKTIENPLARQLQAVARLVAARSTLGVGRQVFFVQMGGFDTHDGQNKRHAELMARLDHALAYFDTALYDLGVRNNVTAFTASDFGRTFTSNGDGTDHGWGSHQFVLGGAVRGGRLYGTFPVLATKNANNNQFDGSPDQLANGVLLPSTSLDQYGYTLAQWFQASNAGAVFANASNFSSANLGFV